jgi:YVTN family beta-propeller protein
MAKDPGDRFASAGALGRAALAAAGLAAESVEATAEFRTTAVRRSRRRVSGIKAAAVVALGVAAGLGALVLARDGPEGRTSQAARAPAEPREPRTIPVGGRPVAIAGERGNVWALVGARAKTALGVVEAGGTRLVAISPSGKVRRGPVLQRGGEDLVSDRGSLYAVFDRPSRVRRLDRRTLRSVAASERFTMPTGRLAVGAGAVWVTERSTNPAEPDHVIKLHPRTLATVARIPVQNGARDVRIGGGSLWVANRDTDSVSEVDPGTGEVVATVTAGLMTQELAYGAGSVWSANGDGTVTRVDVRTRTPVVLAVGSRPSSIEFRGDEVWVASLPTNSVTRIDARRTQTDEPIPTCLNPASLTIMRDDVWVACVGDRTVARIPRPR